MLNYTNRDDCPGIVALKFKEVLEKLKLASVTNVTEGSGEDQEEYLVEP